MSSAGAAVGVALYVGRGDWSERKDSGSLVGERRGRKGNQATWANTWGSAQTLCTQMCTQLRLPGSRRRLGFSPSHLVLFFFFFFFLFLVVLFVFPSPPLCSPIYSVCLFLSSTLCFCVALSASPAHLDDYSKVKRLEKTLNRASR